MPTNKETSNKQTIAKRKQVKEKSELSSQTLIGILGSIQEALYVLDHDWNIVYINNIAAGKAGLPKNLLGKNFWEVYPKLLGTIIEENYRSAMKNREIKRFESRGHYSDPLYEISVFPSAEGITVLGTNITKRKEIEDALRATEQQLKIITENSQDGINLLELKTGKYIFMNPAQVALTGFTADEINNISAEEAYQRTHPEDRQLTIAQQKKVAAGDDTSEPVEYRWKVKSGEYRWFSDSRKLVRDEKGKAVAMVGISRDITERKKAEEALKQSEEQARQRAEELQKLMDMIPAAIWVSNDPECKVIVGNQTANRFYEAAGGENVSAGPASGGQKDTTRRFFKDGKELPPEELPMQEAASKKKEIKNSELEVLAPSGRKMTILGSAKPLLTNEGKVRGCLAAFIDITERKNTEDTLKTTLNRFYRSLANMHGAILLVSDESRVEFANQSFCDYFSLKESPSDLIGLTAGVIIEKIKKGYVYPDQEDTRIKEIVTAGKTVTGEEVAMKGNRTCLRDFIPLPTAGKAFSRLWHHMDITDRKRAEDTIKESEQRWATTLSSIGDAVIATDTKGKIVFMNNQAESLTGWKLEEASQKPTKTVFNIINERTRLEVESPIERALREGIVVGLANHTVLIRKDGKEIPVDDSGAPIKDGNGKTTGVVLVFRDITQRRQADQDRERLSAIVESTDDAIIGKTLDGTITSWNKAAAKLYGYTASEVIGRPISVVIPTDHMNEFKQILDRLHNGERIEHRDTIRLHKDGTRLDVDVTVAPIKNRYGEIVGASTIARDITERKKVEEALKENEQLYHTVFDNSQDGFQLIELIYDKNGKPIDHKFLKVNHAYESIIGVKADDILDKTAKYISPNQEFHWLEVPDRVAKTGISEHVELYNKDIGKWLDCFYFRYSKNVVGTLFRDITGRKKLEKQLQDSERLAAIGATAGMVGHDIRNPLQAITSDVFLAKSELACFPESEEKKNALESMCEIEKNIDYINKIVQDLQDYARPLNPKIEESDLKSIAEAFITKNGLPKNIRVELKIADQAIWIRADSYYLNRILFNLVTNAVQAMPNGGTLTISAHKEANDTILAVKDTGVGIPCEVQDKMFTLMFTTKSKGQGFGLPVVKRMTESLGGTVTFESQEGKGTTFTVRLPPPKN